MENTKYTKGQTFANNADKTITVKRNKETNIIKCYTCNCTTGIKDKDNYCNMCEHYF